VIADANPAARSHSTEALQAAFLTILPRIELHGRVFFRGVPCPHRREDAVAEVVALSWVWFVRLVAKGKDPLTFPMMLATYAAKAVKCGRRACGQEKGKDVMSVVAQQRHHFTVEPLPCSIASTHEGRHGATRGQRRQDSWEERLHDNTLTPIPEQVAFRLDFPAWLDSLTSRERRLVGEMANNERTMDLSQRFELSPARISQLRRELHNDWQRFNGDGENPTPIAAHAC
jgi:hypothetical protein